MHLYEDESHETHAALQVVQTTKVQIVHLLSKGTCPTASRARNVLIPTGPAKALFSSHAGGQARNRQNATAVLSARAILR